jgi:hypothetical protein
MTAPKNEGTLNGMKVVLRVPVIKKFAVHTRGKAFISAIDVPKLVQMCLGIVRYFGAVI